MGSKKREGKDVQCGSILGVRPPLDEDPLFHLWLLQVSIACSLTFNLFDAAVDGLPGYILLILASGFVLLGVYMRMRKKRPIMHAEEEMRLCDITQNEKFACLDSYRISKRFE